MNSAHDGHRNPQLSPDAASVAAPPAQKRWDFSPKCRIVTGVHHQVLTTTAGKVARAKLSLFSQISVCFAEAAEPVQSKELYPA